MAIKLGNIDIQNIYLGDKPIQGVYLGSQEIWSSIKLSSFEVADYSSGSVRRKTYYFEKPMQWIQFINSPYNINNIFSIDSLDYVLYKGESLYAGPDLVNYLNNIETDPDAGEYSIG